MRFGGPIREAMAASPANSDEPDEGNQYASIVLKSAAALAVEGRPLGVRIATDELGFERVKLSDVDDNFALLSAWFEVSPRAPRTSTLAKAFLHADCVEGRKHSNATRVASQTCWAKYEADKMHLLCSYVLRCWRRSKHGARSVALARLKLIIEQHDDADRENGSDPKDSQMSGDLPDYPRSGMSDTDDGGSNGASVDEDPNTNEDRRND